MNKTTDSFKHLQAVIKDVNGDNQQIIKSLQDQDGANIFQQELWNVPQGENFIRLHFITP